MPPEISRVVSLPKRNEYYRHWKGGVYKIVSDLVKHTETEEQLVIYEDEQRKRYARPLSMFLGIVKESGSDKIKNIQRFTKMTDGEINAFLFDEAEGVEVTQTLEFDDFQSLEYDKRFEAWVNYLPDQEKHKDCWTSLTASRNFKKKNPVQMHDFDVVDEWEITHNNQSSIRTYNFKGDYNDAMIEIMEYYEEYDEENLT